ncbi:MAG: PAS domain S-box protein [Fibrobacteria bacterium]
MSIEQSATPESPNQGPVRETWQTLLVILTSVFLVGGYVYYRSEDSRIRREQSSVISVISELKAGQVEHWRFERTADARVAAMDPVLIKAVAAYRRDTAAAEPRKLIRASLAARAVAYLYPEVRLFFDDGTMLSTMGGQAAASVDSATARTIAAVLEGGDARLSNFYITPEGKVRVDAVSALRDSAVGDIGVLVLSCDPDLFFNPLIRFWPKASRTAKAWIVERQGKDIAYLGGGSGRKGVRLPWKKGSMEMAPVAVRAALESQGAFEGEDGDGVRVLADLRRISGSEWWIVSQVASDEILAEGRFRLRAIAIIVAAVVLLSLTSFILMHRQRQAALFKERYLAERRRRQDQEARRILLDSIGDAVITTDNTGVVREMNPAAVALTGWTETEAQGRPLLEVVPVKDPDLPSEPHGFPAMIGNDTEIARFEPHSVLTRRDGSRRQVVRNASPIRGLQGETTGSVVVFSDRSREHAARQALRESEAKFRSVLESMNLIAVILDEKGRVGLCSDFLLELTGWPRSEVIGRDWFERFLPQETRRETLEVFARFFAGNPPKRYENEIVTRQGRRRLIGWSSSTLNDKDGKPIGVVAFGEDITERKQSEDRIRQSEQRLQLLVEHCPGAIAMFDTEMRYLVASPRWLEDYHLGNRKIIGKSHYEVFPDIPERWKRIHRRCVGGAIEKCDEDPFPRATGGVEWVRWEIHPWRDDHGEIGGIVMFTEVITPRKVAQEELKKLNAELELRVQERTAQLAAKNKELETFSYSVSHDLKAPLRGIDGYSRILLDEYVGKIDEEGQGFLHNIRSGTEQMQNLIEDMLDYSKLERRSLSLAPQDLRTAVDRVLGERRFDLGEAQLVLDVAPGAVKADHEGLAIVLRNLIDNAVKFSRRRKPPVIEIRSYLDGSRHVLTVKDNGTGFSMKHHDLMFQIFQRLHRAEEYGGTGVGLAIVKKAMDRMDGRVWAEGEPDKGAVFSIELPVAEAAA